MDVDREFIDMDFTKHPQYVRGDLGVRPFGKVFRSYADAVPEIPEANWQKLTEDMEAAGGGIENLVTRIFDQGQEGSCVGNAATQGHEIIQADQFGKENVVQLSAISLYKQIGSSPNSGSNVNDALDASQSTGILPLDNEENRKRFGVNVMPHTGFYTPYPSAWKNTAKLFRVDEAYVVQSVAGLMTAGLLRHPIIVGRSGHSICYCRPAYRNGALGFIYANSWTPQWGFAAGDFQGGFGFDSLSMVRASASWAYVIRSVIVPDFATAA